MNAEFGTSYQLGNPVEPIRSVIRVFRGNPWNKSKVDYGKCYCLKYRSELFIEWTIDKDRAVKRRAQS